MEMFNIRKFGKNAWSILRQTLIEYQRDRVFRMGAALAYYAIFSIPAAIIIILSASSVFISRSAMADELFAQIALIAGKDISLFLYKLVESIEQTGDESSISITGFILLMFAASGGFYVLQESLNNVFGVRPKNGKGILNIVLDRLLAFVTVLCIGIIIMIIMLFNTIFNTYSEHIIGVFPNYYDYFIFAFHRTISFSTLTLFFVLLYRVLPDIKLTWNYLFLWAILTTCFFWLGKISLGYYFKTSATWSAYGTASSIIAILIWVYYSSQLLFIVAEFIKVLARNRGVEIMPRSYAEKS